MSRIVRNRTVFQKKKRPPASSTVKATMYKNSNRDTAWFSILDTEWPALKAAFRRWLDPSNFDGQGRQKQSLSDLTAAATSG